MEESIRNYSVSRLIGNGDFGNVYRAQLKETKHYVAIKYVPIQRNKLDEYLIKRIIEEVNTHRRLIHPNILKVEHCFKDDKYVYFVSELCEDGDLLLYMKSHGKLLESEARHLMLQIVDAMLYLHRNGIAHLELKLENILIKNPKQVKVAVFGLANIKENRPRKTISGTPNHIPPEMLKVKRLCPAAVVWQLGIIFYTFLSGNTNDATESYRPVKSISEEAKDLLRKLLQELPEKRIALKDVMKHPFMQNTKDFHHRKINQDLSTDNGLSSGMKSTLSSVHLSQEDRTLKQLNAKRLRYIRKWFKNGIGTIMENGDVCMEIFGNGQSEKNIGHVIIVSGDGNQITNYMFRDGKGLPAKDQPIDLRNLPFKSYTFDDLQSKHVPKLVKKYKCVERFVQMVKSKTPKVTLYAEMGRGVLMESGPDAFQTTFYDGTRLISKGQSWVWEPENKKPIHAQERQKDAEKIKEVCLMVESALSKVQEIVSFCVFPAILGRRRIASGEFSDNHNVRSTNSDQTSIISLDSTCTGMSNVTTDSGGQECSAFDSFKMRSQSHIPDPRDNRHMRRNSNKPVYKTEKFEFGTIKTFEDSAWEVDFTNGTKFEKSRDGTVVCFTDTLGQKTRYQPQDLSKPLPKHVLRCLQLVVKCRA